MYLPQDKASGGRLDAVDRRSRDERIDELIRGEQPGADGNRRANHVPNLVTRKPVPQDTQFDDAVRSLYQFDAANGPRPTRTGPLVKRCKIVRPFQCSKNCGQALQVNCSSEESRVLSECPAA